jgi:phage-related minor tail protein
MTVAAHESCDSQAARRRDAMRLFRSIEARTSVGDQESDEAPTEARDTPPERELPEEAPTEAQAPFTGGAGGAPPEPPTQAHQPAGNDDGRKRNGRKVGAPLIILGLVVFVAWGLPILHGFHFGCNLLAGDKFREVRLGLEMCRGENQAEANERTEKAQQEQQAKEHSEAEAKKAEHEKEERERPEREARERQEAQESAEREHKLQAEEKKSEEEAKAQDRKTEEEDKRTEQEDQRSQEKDEREEHEAQVKEEAEAKRSQEEVERG